MGEQVSRHWSNQETARANRRIAREKVLPPLVPRQEHIIDIEDHLHYSTNVLIHKGVKKVLRLEFVALIPTPLLISGGLYGSANNYGHLCTLSNLSLMEK